MTTEIHKRDNFMTVFDNLLPILILVLVESIWDYLLSILGETHDFLGDGAGPAWFLFMPEIEYSSSGYTIAIIGHSFGQHRDESGLACIHIAYDA